jgi:ABC-type sulfate transport system permease component
MCLYLFITFAVLSLFIICPLTALDQRSLPGLNLLTFGNILDTQRLWSHLVLTVLYSGKSSLDNISRELDNI